MKATLKTLQREKRLNECIYMRAFFHQPVQRAAACTRQAKRNVSLYFLNTYNFCLKATERKREFRR